MQRKPSCRCVKRDKTDHANRACNTHRLCLKTRKPRFPRFFRGTKLSKKDLAAESRVATCSKFQRIRRETFQGSKMTPVTQTTGYSRVSNSLSCSHGTCFHLTEVALDVLCLGSSVARPSKALQLACLYLGDLEPGVTGVPFCGALLRLRSMRP